MFVQRIIIFTSIFFSSLILAEDKIQYSSEKKQYLLNFEQMPVGYFLNKFSQYSGIGIEYDKRINDAIDMDDPAATEEQLVRWLETRYSTIKGLNEQGEVLTLKIMPKGQFQSEFLIPAINPIEEGVYQAGNTQGGISKRRYQQRFEQLEEKVRAHQQERIESRLEKKERNKKKQQQRVKKEQEKRKQLEAELDQFRESDPELYQRILEVNRHRYPGLGQKKAEE